MRPRALKLILAWPFVKREAEGALAALPQPPGKSLKNRARDTNHDLGDEPVPSDPLRRFSGVQARVERRDSAGMPVAAEASALPLISIGAPADPALLEPTYAYLSAYSFACLPPQVAQRLNVAIYELYANALRYGASSGEVRLELWRSDAGVGLRVSNRAEPRQLERLRQQIARVQADAEAAFSMEMNRFAGSSQPPPMLGLVRVAHEAALALDLAVDGERITLSTWCGG